MLQSRVFCGSNHEIRLTNQIKIWLKLAPFKQNGLGALQLGEVPGYGNLSYCRLVPLCLGVHWDVHVVGVVDEAGLDGLPEQGLFICFKQSQIEVIDVNMLIFVVD